MKPPARQRKGSAATSGERDGAPAVKVSTRDLILEASRDLFNSDGFDGSSIAMICERIGIMAGNLTYYFPKKRDIVVALKERFDGEISKLENQLLTDLLSGADDPSPATTHRLLRSMLEVIWDYQFFFISMHALHRLDPDIVDEFRQVEQQSRMGLAQICQRAINAGTVRQVYYPNSPSALADTIWYLMWGCMFFHKVRDKDLEPGRQMVVNACLLQLGALIEPLVSAEFINEYCKEVSSGR